MPVISNLDFQRKAERNTKTETYLYPRPKSGKYNMISVARQNECKITISPPYI
jgi:hypothetical protein